MRMMEFERMTALVTGGASGLGLAYAEELLRMRAGHVMLFDLASSEGKEVAERLNEEFGQGRASYIAGDVAKPKEFEAAIKEAIEDFGGLDILINNADLLNELQWERMISTNVTGVLHGNLLGFKHMGKDKGGKGGVIVNAASIAGVVPFASLPVYTATKHAVIGMSRSFAMPYHYEKTGIRVLTVCPGVVETHLGADIPDKTLDIIDKDSVIKEFDPENYPIQQVKHVSRTMVRIIRSAPNGSVWIVEGGEPAYQISIPERSAMRMRL